MDFQTYYIPGLGADERVFSFLNMGKYAGKPIQWVTPTQGETIQEYVRKLLPQIDTTRKVYLIGVSFGGIVAQEIAQLMAVEKLIIISSIKHPQEMGFSLQMVKKWRLYALFPANILLKLNLLTGNYYFGITSAEESTLLKAIISDTDVVFMSWAIRALMHWQPTNLVAKILHLHGTKDRIFPIKPIQKCVSIMGGTHFMIVQEADTISKLIIDFLSDV